MVSRRPSAIADPDRAAASSAILGPTCSRASRIDRATARSSSPPVTSRRGQQVEAAEAAEVADRRRAALAYVDQSRGREALQGLADGGARDAEHLGEPALAGQRLARAEVAAGHLGDQLVEDVVGNGAALHGAEGHARRR